MKKKANELKPGDVFWIKRDMLMYLSALGPDLAISGVHCYVLNAALSNPLTTRYLYDNEMYVTEVNQNLTPAQQHADEMLELVRKVAGMRSPSSAATSVIVKAGQLLDKITPALPPTLEETLKLLEELRTSQGASALSIPHTLVVEDVLERARRTGVLK